MEKSKKKSENRPKKGQTKVKHRSQLEQVKTNQIKVKKYP